MQLKKGCGAQGWADDEGRAPHQVTEVSKDDSVTHALCGKVGLFIARHLPSFTGNGEASASAQVRGGGRLLEPADAETTAPGQSESNESLRLPHLPQLEGEVLQRSSSVAARRSCCDVT